MANGPSEFEQREDRGAAFIIDELARYLITDTALRYLPIKLECNIRMCYETSDGTLAPRAGREKYLRVTHGQLPSNLLPFRLTNKVDPRSVSEGSSIGVTMILKTAMRKQFYVSYRCEKKKNEKKNAMETYFSDRSHLCQFRLHTVRNFSVFYEVDTFVSSRFRQIDGTSTMIRAPMGNGSVYFLRTSYYLRKDRAFEYLDRYWDYSSNFSVFEYSNISVIRIIEYFSDSNTRILR